MTHEALSELVVHEVITNISGRRGLDIYELDEETQEEISETLEGIVFRMLKKHTLPLEPTTT